MRTAIVLHNLINNKVLQLLNWLSEIGGYLEYSRSYLTCTVKVLHSCIHFPNIIKLSICFFKIYES